MERYRPKLRWLLRRYLSVQVVRVKKQLNTEILNFRPLLTLNMIKAPMA
jgi:hypothetical protein